MTGINLACHRVVRLFLTLLLLSSISVSAQVVNVNRTQTFRQEVAPEAVDNYMFSSYFTNAKKAYNLRGFEIGSAKNKIRDIKVNPAGYSFAILYNESDSSAVKIKSFNPARKIDVVLSGLVAPSAICYMPDSRQIAVADDGKIKFYDSKTFSLEREIPLKGTPTALTIHPSGNLAIAVSPNTVQVLSLTAGEVRKTIDVSSATSAAFNSGGSQFGILTGTGNLTIYSTDDLSVITTINNLGLSKNLFFHPEENYVGMINNGDRVQFINLFDNTDRPAIYDNNLSWARFLRDGQGNIYLATVGGNDIKYRQIDGLSPNYSLLVSNRVEELMREWTKMRPGETELEYQARVNEESIRRQRILFANEVASELALTAGLGNFSDIRLGRYNPVDGTLVISLGGLNDIYLQVPQEDMAGFGDGNNLQFSNQVFSVRKDNTFELIYVQVYNPTNLKTYTFDNLEGQDLSFLFPDSKFVSLDLIKLSSREDLLLKGIKDRIIDEARKNNILSDYTTIDVNTYVEPSTDDLGRQIKNYHVDFSYKVDEKGSDAEDFAPGEYLINQSPAALYLVRIIQQALNGEFAPYIVPGKSLIVDITGSADALPVNRIIPYDGTLGEYDEEPCYINGNLTTISVNKKQGIRTNEQLAFLRAQAVQNEIAQHLPRINDMNVTYKNNIEVSKEKGAEFRRIRVSLIFLDAF